MSLKTKFLVGVLVVSVIYNVFIYNMYQSQHGVHKTHKHKSERYKEKLPGEKRDLHRNAYRGQENSEDRLNTGHDNKKDDKHQELQYISSIGEEIHKSLDELDPDDVIPTPEPETRRGFLGEILHLPLRVLSDDKDGNHGNRENPSYYGSVDREEDSKDELERDRQEETSLPVLMEVDFEGRDTIIQRQIPLKGQTLPTLPPSYTRYRDPLPGVTGPGVTGPGVTGPEVAPHPENLHGQGSVQENARGNILKSSGNNGYKERGAGRVRLTLPPASVADPVIPAHAQRGQGQPEPEVLSLELGAQEIQQAKAGENEKIQQTKVEASVNQVKDMNKTHSSHEEVGPNNQSSAKFDDGAEYRPGKAVDPHESLLEAMHISVPSTAAPVPASTLPPAPPGTPVPPGTPAPPGLPSPTGSVGLDVLLSNMDGWNKKIILLYTPLFREISWGLPLDSARFRDCPVPFCTLTLDRRIGTRADAVIFHLRDYSWRPGDIPRMRDPAQIYVILSMETPHTDPYRQDYFNMFNWTMTYRQDSDVITQYGVIRERAVPVPEVDYQAMIRGKTRAVAWMVSNCHTQSGRERYVSELARYIPVDVYGDCGTLSCPRDLHTGDAACLGLLSRNYYFYLSLENALCRDYVTEKFYMAQGRDLVPVVRGDGDYRRLSPGKWYINTADFPSPRHLADYLRHLMDNPREYVDYLRGKEKYEIRPLYSVAEMPAWCDLCEKLHKTGGNISKTRGNNSTTGEIYRKTGGENNKKEENTDSIRGEDPGVRVSSKTVDMMSWWSESASCREPSDLQPWFGGGTPLTGNKADTNG